MDEEFGVSNLVEQEFAQDKRVCEPSAPRQHFLDLLVIQVIL